MYSYLMKIHFVTRTKEGNDRNEGVKTGRMLDVSCWGVCDLLFWAGIIVVTVRDLSNRFEPCSLFPCDMRPSFACALLTMSLAETRATLLHVSSFVQVCYPPVLNCNDLS